MDFSFLKLYKNNFDGAVLNDNTKAFLNKFTGFVQMKTDDWFVQITNCADNIAFGGNITIELIDFCQNVRFTFTKNVNFFYKEITDINGIKQIAFKFGNVGIDFGEEIFFLKISHTTSFKVWYSAGFCITNHESENTSLIRYKNEDYFKGISYDVSNDFQVIRLQCFKTDGDYKEEKEEEIQITGTSMSSRATSTLVDKYVMYLCDFFTWKRMQVMLDHDIIYIDDYRITNKPTITKGERIPDSNVFQVDFDADPDEELFDFGFEVVNKSPLGVYDIALLPTDIDISFNQSIALDSGFIKLYTDADVLLATFTEADAAMSGTDGIQIAMATAGLGVGKYYILLGNGLVKSWQGDDISITDKRVWPFEITDDLRRYNPERYNDNEYE